MDTTITRPIARYHGGKWMLAPWILEHVPAHRIYVEPYGGVASVLLRKARSYSEVYNDLDGEVVNLFSVLRSPERSERLRDLLVLTPFSRDEFVGAYLDTDDSVERARRTLIRAFMGFGSAGITKAHNTGFRARSRLQTTPAARDWSNYPESVRAFTERSRGVVIENRPGLEVIQQQDSPDTLFYVDPPYVHASRSTVAHEGKPNCYAHEMDEDEHCELARALHSVVGMVVLSGYESELYDWQYRGWAQKTKRTTADGGVVRVESLWLNPQASRALCQGRLFEVSG